MDSKANSATPLSLVRQPPTWIAATLLVASCNDSPDGPSEEALERAERQYVECMAELGYEVEEVSLDPNNIDVRLVPGEYERDELIAATEYCEAEVAPLLDGQTMQQCEHELSAESDTAGKLGIAFDHYDPADCDPNEEVWERSVEELIGERCGDCHGDEPAFGAPVSLTEFEKLMEGDPGNRLVDRIGLRTAAHTMPPPNSPELEHSELDLLVEWATCGEVHPDPSVGVVADRPVYAIENQGNLDLPHFDLLADDFALDEDELDRYQCFGFDVPLDEERLLRRIQVSVDESRVLHHILVMDDPGRSSEGDSAFRCEDWPLDDTPILWAWGPGGGAFDFPEGGLSMGPGERVVVQIHYNNGAGIEDVRDNSGVRIFHGPTGDREWFMLTTGSEDFDVPEGESVACGDVGPIDATFRVLSAFPHMHVLGAELHSTIEHEDGTSDDLLHLTGWNFESQHFYAVDALLEPGDSIHTWCGFRNDTGKPTTSGSRTDQEMCFNFLYVSPE